MPPFSFAAGPGGALPFYDARKKCDNKTIDKTTSPISISKKDEVIVRS
jgi:hypothetical protein